jgi:hypothetical protein
MEAFIKAREIEKGITSTLSYLKFFEILKKA